MKLADENKSMLVAVSSGALFDTQEEEEIFRTGGLEAFYRYREEIGDQPFEKGTAFYLIESLLKMNGSRQQPIVKIYIVSHNDPSVCLRVTRSAQHHGLKIERALFCGGADLIPYLKNARFDLFLSRSMPDVRAALAVNVPSAMVYPPPGEAISGNGELRIAFDGDAVLFSDEAEKVYQAAKEEATRRNLGRRYPVDKFILHEVSKNGVPLPEGPFTPFGKAVSSLQRIAERDGGVRVRVALITARSLPAHERALNSLKFYGIHIDQALFLSGDEKAPFVKAFDPHIFFDDQHLHLVESCKLSPSAIVPPLNVEIPQPTEIVHQKPKFVDPDLMPPPAPFVAKRESLSQSVFDAQCREILIDYIPFQERKRGLSPKFRQLIASGKTKSGEERHQIIKELEKYRLGKDAVGFEPLLNREGGGFLQKMQTLFAPTEDTKQGKLFD